jgi:hypothetical protein
VDEDAAITRELDEVSAHFASLRRNVTAASRIGAELAPVHAELRRLARENAEAGERLARALEPREN